MRMMDVLHLLDTGIDPRKTKIHLAVNNGKDDPLDLYREGRFREWQQWQSRCNFEREFVVALIQKPEPNQWLFAGAYTARGRCPSGDGYSYDLDERQACRELDGYLIAHFQRPGRQSFLNADRWADQIIVSEIRPERDSVPPFPGFKGLCISKSTLDLVVRLNHEGWRNPLSSVAGVYLISDTQSGKLYVGSATGAGGIWARWHCYANTGHGGNKLLIELLKTDSLKRSQALQFSLLEIADTHTTQKEVIAREEHWKQVLLTRIHGFNAKELGR